MTNMTMQTGGHPLKQGSRERFAQGVAAGMNQADAYRQAYEAAGGWKPETLWSRASRLASDRQVCTRIEWLKRQAASTAQMTRQRALEILSSMAVARFADFMDRNGEMDLAKAAANPAVESLEITVDKDGRKRIKVRLANKIAVIERLAKMEGWDAAKKHDHCLHEAEEYRKKIEQLDAEMAKLSIDDLRALAERIREQDQAKAAMARVRGKAASGDDEDSCREHMPARHRQWA